MPFRMPFAGEGESFSPDSVLSHCYGALLPMFTTAEATVLRRLCREFKTTVAEFPWEDKGTLIRGSVAAWRACFPWARWANVDAFPGIGRWTPVVDDDFVHFVGLKWLNMSSSRGVTDAAFVHLKGIHTLIMYDCFQPTITDAAFAHLKGIHTLDLGGCYQKTITPSAFAHLKGIHSLSLYNCSLTSELLIHLKGIKRLNLGHSPQLVLTGDFLKGIEWLNLHGHSQAQVVKARSYGYPVELPLSGGT